MHSCGVAMIDFGGFHTPEQMLGRMDPDRVFTRVETLRSRQGVTLQHWAGRLAAKHAVLRLLGLPVTEEWLFQAEVVPSPSSLCRSDHRCLHGHPPRVVLGPDLELAVMADGCDAVVVSITHSDTTSLAVAVPSRRRTEPCARGRS